MTYIIFWGLWRLPFQDNSGDVRNTTRAHHVPKHVQLFQAKPKMLSVKPNQAGPSCHVSHCVTLCQPYPARPARYPSWRAHSTRIATGCMQSDAGTKSPGSVMRIASGIATRQSFLNNIRDSMSCSNFDLICGRVRKNAGSYCSCQKAVWTLSSDKPNLSTPENSSTVLKLWTFRRFSPHASSWRNNISV